MDTTAIIRVNGESEPLVAETLAALVAEKIDAGQRGVAVALNGTVVPRAAWAQTPLRAGDSIEIVRARQGG
jgi:sulfur carrier protein